MNSQYFVLQREFWSLTELVYLALRYLCQMDQIAWPTWIFLYLQSQLDIQKSEYPEISYVK